MVSNVFNVSNTAKEIRMENKGSELDPALSPAPDSRLLGLQKA
ncbi:predicted protein [Botrytis cinerea T4]|uniref:Uncharacterized protein n=1 Tax=Botryotinia fuckeliana (strain T4) TaxID=999810 RepID=G2XN37_BOTF4|nr:predicted protein [Botrytis cinerea T4]